ncbi:EamA family transporter RarD [Motilibacter aurantiacus]|uniref:EamA family transporter RarD n=1 Tax=Motilibacter aurantiacus TaxID=2714955 RepID=UPI00140B1002|nr:EamA family transporter RarD [Motilibacter aurantiacus]
METPAPSTSPGASAAEAAGRGTLFGAAAYLLWGLFPLYWPLLEPAGALEILAHRMVWSLAAVGVLLAVTRRGLPWRGLGRRRVGLLMAAGAVVSVNWLVYIVGVNSGHTVETSLGYFINPLVTILFGVFLLGEKLRRPQWVAVGIAAAAVVVLTGAYGRPPWIALILALSFGTYGLLKNRAKVDAVSSLGVETATVAPFALAYIVALQAAGDATFGSEGAGQAALLVGSGVVTAIPLLLFGAAAVRVPLTVMGLLQYLAPVVQFLIGVLVQHEHMPASRWAGFALVWLALVVLTVDGLRARRAASRPLVEAATEPEAAPA